MQVKLLRQLSSLVLLIAASATLLAAAEVPGVVNINTAGAEQLALLPRVGPAVAERIVEFRDQNGSFKATEDLMLVRGIGETTYELLEPYIVLSGETTLSEKVRVPRPAALEDSQ